MLIRALSALVAVSVLAGCESPRHTGAGATATPPAVTAPAESYPANAVVYRGANGALRSAGGRNGVLYVFAEVRRDPDGTTRTSVMYQKNARCREQEVAPGERTVLCPTEWTEKHDLRANALTVDAALASASFTDTLRGKRVVATWVAFGARQRQENANDNLLYETRDATGDIAWGDAHYVDPPGAESPGSLFTRVTASTS